jgi:hypothetical protein
MERMMWIVEVVQRVLSEHVLDQNAKRMLIDKQKFVSASLELTVTLCAYSCTVRTTLHNIRVARCTRVYRCHKAAGSDGKCTDDGGLLFLK